MSVAIVRQEPEHWLIAQAGERRLAIGARWFADRWMPYVARQDNGRLLPAINLIEWDAGEDSSSNPAFQQVHGRTIGEDVGELLFVGQVGGRHCSAALRLELHGVHLEIAERWNESESAEELRVCWATGAGVTPQWRDGGVGLLFGLEGAPAWTLDAIPDGTASWEVQSKLAWLRVPTAKSPDRGTIAPYGFRLRAIPIQ